MPAGGGKKSTGTYSSFQVHEGRDTFERWGEKKVQGKFFGERKLK